MAKFVTAKEAAEILGIDRRSVVYAIERGRLPAIKMAGLLYQISLVDLARFRQKRERRIASANGQARSQKSRHKTVRKARAK